MFDEMALPAAIHTNNYCQETEPPHLLIRSHRPGAFERQAVIDVLPVPRRRHCRRTCGGGSESVGRSGGGRRRRWRRRRRLRQRLISDEGAQHPSSIHPIIHVTFINSNFGLLGSYSSLCQLIQQQQKEIKPRV